MHVPLPQWSLWLMMDVFASWVPYSLFLGSIGTPPALPTASFCPVPLGMQGKRTPFRQHTLLSEPPVLGKPAH